MKKTCLINDKETFLFIKPPFKLPTVKLSHRCISDPGLNPLDSGLN